jgi:ribonuclease PH
MEKRQMVKAGKVLKDQVAAVSCGVFLGNPILDLDYTEDSAAETDANFVMTGSGGIVEIQGTAEEKPLSEEEFQALFNLAKTGIADLVSLQKETISI